MLSYVIRRLLLMVPTVVGVLFLCFGVMRLQSASLIESMQAQAGPHEGSSAKGELRNQSSLVAIENNIARFVRTGNDLPALFNLRGWLGKDEVVALLRRSEDSAVLPSERLRAQSELWLLGHFGVVPLQAVIADDALAALHGAASVALSFCMFIPLNAEDVLSMDAQRQDFVHLRNFELRKLRFPTGTADPEYANKRGRLLALCARDSAEFAHSTLSACRALFLETGFSDFFSKLLTGRLYSETRGDYVFHVIAERWYVTFWLNFVSIIIAWAGSILIGIRSARRQGTLEDRTTTTSLFILYSVPSFFAGTLMLHHLCTNSDDGRAWFPSHGIVSDDALWMPTWRWLLDLAWHACLPLAVLCYGSFTSLSRYMRASLLEQLQSDYVRSARAKGCNEDGVTYGHALPNSMITMITLGSGLLAELFGSSVFVESIFSIPGIGWLLLEAARQQDAPLVMGATLVSVLLVLVGILIADILYAVVDPRIRARYA